MPVRPGTKAWTAGDWSFPASIGMTDWLRHPDYAMRSAPCIRSRNEADPHRGIDAKLTTFARIRKRQNQCVFKHFARSLLLKGLFSVAMGSGTDVAQESADIVLLGNDLECFVDTIKVSRQTRSIIWQNFAGTIGIDLLGMGLAAFGLLEPLLAAFIHVASEMTFILNSARLLRKTRSEGQHQKPWPISIAKSSKHPFP